jgi:tetratricopeptide (TPR) repeat protein
MEVIRKKKQSVSYNLLHRLNSFIDEKRNIFLFILFGISLLLRLFYFFEMAAGPYGNHLTMDSLYHDWWVRQIASGKLIGEEAFEKVVTIIPDNIKALYKLGLSYARLGYTMRAVQYFIKTINTDRDSMHITEIRMIHAHTHLELGLIFEEEGDYSLALREYSDAAALNPSSPLIFTAPGRLYIKIGNKARVVKAL